MNLRKPPKRKTLGKHIKICLKINVEITMKFKIHNEFLSYLLGKWIAKSYTKNNLLIVINGYLNCLVFGVFFVFFFFSFLKFS